MEEENKDVIENTQSIEITEEKNNEKEASNASDKKGISIAAMVLGICSIIFAISSRSFLIPIACGILAIIFGVKGRDGSSPKMAKSGFIMGIIGLSLQLAMIFILLIAGTFFISMLL